MGNYNNFDNTFQLRSQPTGINGPNGPIYAYNIDLHNVENFTLLGGTGNDNFATGSGDDVPFGGQGQEHLNAGDGNDAISGGDGDDNLDGGNGFDVLNGGAGNDFLAVGAGTDAIDGPALTGCFCSDPI